MPAPAPENPDRVRHRRETEAAAVLLLRRRRYDLPTLVRQQGIKPKPFRQIRPTLALKADMAAPHLTIASAWAAHTDAIADAYDPDDTSNAHRQLALAAASLAGFLTVAKERIPGHVRRIEGWHRAQWIGRVQASTGLDVTMLTLPADVAADAAKAITWGQALADDVSQQVRQRIVTALATGGSAEDVRRAIGDAVKRGKRRALGIGDDQTDKLSRAMDRSRRIAAGVTSYVWHHTPQRHPRDWHQARNGKTFTPETEPEAGDRAGEPPFCKCWTSPVLAP